MKELPMFTLMYEWGIAYTQIHHANYCVQLSTLYCIVLYCIMRPYTGYIAMSNNFKHSHVHFTHFFSVTKLDLVIQALLLDYILALGKKYAYASRASSFYIEINIFQHF